MTAQQEQIHVDEHEIRRCKDLLGFDTGDAHRVRQAGPIVRRELDAILAEFHRRQAAVPEIALILGASDQQSRLHYARSLEQKIAERTRELETLSRTDPLTGLLNRRAFTAALLATLRDTDVAARTGGDEFCALLLDTDADAGSGFRERLQLHLHRLGIEASIGIAAMGPTDFIACDELLGVADGDMYGQKSQRRGSAPEYTGARTVTELQPRASA